MNSKYTFPLTGKSYVLLVAPLAALYTSFVFLTNSLETPDHPVACLCFVSKRSKKILFLGQIIDEELAYRKRACIVIAFAISIKRESDPTVTQPDVIVK